MSDFVVAIVSEAPNYNEEKLRLATLRYAGGDPHYCIEFVVGADPGIVCMTDGPLGAPYEVDALTRFINCTRALAGTPLPADVEPGAITRELEQLRAEVETAEAEAEEVRAEALWLRGRVREIEEANGRLRRAVTAASYFRRCYAAEREARQVAARECQFDKDGDSALKALDAWNRRRDLLAEAGIALEAAFANLPALVGEEEKKRDA